MGLFGKLFDKKECDICGGEIGLLGNRKLEDGNLCKHCAKKLSYWFDDRRHSTVEDIRQQLAYREENSKKVEAFNITRTIGRYIKVVFDEDNRKLMVVRTNDIRSENPDVIDFSQITGCDFDIDEDRSEEKRRLDDGREVSYNPPRYTWNYDFYVTIRVNHPYFDDMRFQLNSSTVYVESEGALINPGILGTILGQQQFNPRNHPDFIEYSEMGNEIKQALVQMRQQERESTIAASTPKKPVICPMCRATTTPDSNGCCEYCGSPLNK
ncbi:MAG: DUF4428 domain-containing protein [Clostridia bacterium]|nr:DUF4428 domain-containing protein [Clostridia bacterium]